MILQIRMLALKKLCHVNLLLLQTLKDSSVRLTASDLKVPFNFVVFVVFNLLLSVKVNKSALKKSSLESLWILPTKIFELGLGFYLMLLSYLSCCFILKILHEALFIFVAILALMLREVLLKDL